MPRCENADSLPSGMNQIGAGRVTAESSAKMVGTGGQLCFVKLTNNAPHATPLTLRFYTAGTRGETDLCSSTFLMKPLPGSTMFFKNSIFGDVITWRVEVSTTFEVDVADVLCGMYSS